jgi:hypothetical protein
MQLKTIVNSGCTVSNSNFPHLSVVADTLVPFTETVQYGIGEFDLPIAIPLIVLEICPYVEVAQKIANRINKVGLILIITNGIGLSKHGTL